MKFFRQYPLAKYWFENYDDNFMFRNYFIKVELLGYLRDNPTVLTNYVLKADERADVLAHKLYGNSDLYWTLYLVNDILDPKDWVMGSSRFNEYIKEKYLNEDEVLYTVRNGEYADLRTNQFMVQKNPFNTIDSSPDTSLTDPLTYDKITAVESEIRANDNKRVVKAIRKEFMPAFLRDFERKIKSLEGK